MSGIVESITVLLELLAILMCLSNTFGRKISFNVYTMILFIEHLVIMRGVNTNRIPMYMVFLVYIAIFIYGLFYYKSNIRTTVINCLLSFAIVGILQLILYIPVFYFQRIFKSATKMDGILINSLCIIIILIFSYKIKLAVVSDFIKQKNLIMKILFASIMLYLFANIFQMQINQSINNSDFIQIIFFVILFFLALNEWQKAIAEAERKKTQLEMNKLYYDAYDELLTLVRERQHDMKNHISAILGMVYTIDNYDDLVRSQKEYCHDVMEKSKETKLLLSSGNPLIAGFLYRKIQEAKEKEIEVEYKVGASSPDFSIPEYEMVEILGVLLDNAIEALADSEEKTKKIYVEIIDRKNELYITVGNTSRIYRQEEISKFGQKDFTSKGKGHGIGLSKLKKLVHGMDGEIIIVNNKREGANFLEFRIVIPTKKE